MNKLDFRQKFLRRDRAAGKARPLKVRKRRFALPLGLFEFQPEYILGVRISRTFRKVARVAVGDLESGIISPVPGRPNILKPEQVSRTIAAMSKVLGNNRGPFGLLLPDGAVRASILEFETLPADRKERESLVRWKMKSLLPFPIEEARVTLEASAKESGGVEVFAVAARKSVVAEYESLLDILNGDVRLVLPSSAALLPLLSEDRLGGELLLHVSSCTLTAIVVSGRQIRMWRNQPMNGKSMEERLALVTEEAARALAASHDNLGLEISDVRLCARPALPESWVAELARILSREVSSLVPDPQAVGIRLSAEEKELLHEYGATVSGIVANAA